MRANKLRHLFYLQLMAVAVTSVISCNSKSTDDEGEMAITSANTAVTKFYLKANNKVLTNLDSVFFSIDLTTGVIFNADSLPKGTDVSRIVPSITFSNAMSKVQLKFLLDNERDTVVDYVSTTPDSIDFRHPVTLDVTAADGVSTFSYLIKVNIHEQDPDTLAWVPMGTTTLPSRLPAPLGQKTLTHDGKVYCMVVENDYTTTMATTSDLSSGQWNKQELQLSFFPDVESFVSTDDAFYMLDSYGYLMTSADGIQWKATGKKWVTILGGYGDVVLGSKSTESVPTLEFAQFPADPGYVAQIVPDDFPLFHSARLGIVDTGWSENPMAILACGMTSKGLPTGAVWAYDGTNWATINTTSLPALEAPMMARYVVYKDTFRPFKQKVFDIWLLFGGVLEDDTFNRTVYMSFDNGVAWVKAPEGMQMPEDFPYLGNADVIVADQTLSSDLADAWTRSRASNQSSYVIEGTEIYWECPYLYLFGGYLEDNSLSTTVWRGVLNRLTFMPNP